MVFSIFGNLKVHSQWAAVGSRNPIVFKPFYVIILEL